MKLLFIRSLPFPFVPALVPERDGRVSFPFPSPREGTNPGNEWTEEITGVSFPTSAGHPQGALIPSVHPGVASAPWCRMKTAGRVEMLLTGVSAEDRIRHRPVRWAAEIVTDQHRASRSASSSTARPTAFSVRGGTP